MNDLPGIDDWRLLDKADLEQQYSPSSCVEDLDFLLAEYARKSRESESRTRVIKDLRYGEGQDDLLDLFPVVTGSS
jgi:arylformamidase